MTSLLRIADYIINVDHILDVRERFRETGALTDESQPIGISVRLTTGETVLLHKITLDQLWAALRKVGETDRVGDA